MTTPRGAPPGPRTSHQATTPPIPPPRPAGKDLAETAEPYDLPFPDERLPAHPAYLVVIDQLRGTRPGQPFLAELLEPSNNHPPDPEPDLEAEP